MSRPELPAAALRALRDGHLIEAIKLTRAATGLGLAEAKQLVEAHRDDAAAAGTSADRDDSLPAAAMLALQQGRLIEAVKLSREHFGGSLQAAKQAIDRTLAESPTLRAKFEEQRRLNRPNPLAIALVLLVIGGFLWWALL